MLGPCLSSHVADHPLRPATRHRLGEPLPHQLADRTQASSEAINFYFKQKWGDEKTRLGVLFETIQG